MLNDACPTRITVDLGKIRQNFRLIRDSVAPARVLAVVKADAYGHGLCAVSRAVCEEGADMLGVARPTEGIQLRDDGIDAPVLVLGGVNQSGAAECVQYNLIQTVFDEEGVFQAQSAAKRLGRTAQVHIKLDTGMNRIGVRSKDELARVLEAINASENVRLCGAFSHFCDADGQDEAFSLEQIRRFSSLKSLLPKGIVCHMAASAAMARFPQSRFDMVRAGIVLYGYPPVSGILPVSPALSWTTQIAFIKEIQPGDTVSYGRTFTAEHPMRLATLPVGYGDGYFRALSGHADVLIGGQRCPVIGRVCMDQMMADVTGVSQAQKGDTVVLLGRQGGECIDAAELADQAGTIPYEILLSHSPRVPIQYID